MTDEKRAQLKNLNLELADLRDDLHDAKMTGSLEEVTAIETNIKNLTEQKQALLKANNV